MEVTGRRIRALEQTLSGRGLEVTAGPDLLVVGHVPEQVLVAAALQETLLHPFMHDSTHAFGMLINHRPVTGNQIGVLGCQIGVTPFRVSGLASQRRGVTDGLCYFLIGPHAGQQGRQYLPNSAGIGNADYVLGIGST